VSLGVLEIRKVVVKVTGKIFDNENGVDVLASLSSLISSKADEGYRFAVVVGGGRRARDYIELGRKLGLSEGQLDAVGIEVSRVNAILLAFTLGPRAYLPIPRSIDEFLRAWTSSKVVVLGGLQPGQSTNAVAAIVAEMINADLILNATDVDGIYDSNPKKNPQAKLLKEVHIKELEEMLSDKELAGYYELFDRVGLNIVKRSKIPLVFLSVYNTENIRRAINGEEFVGTRIVY